MTSFQYKVMTFKAGGASLHDLKSIRTTVKIIKSAIEGKQEPRCRLLVVVSALKGQTTKLQKIADMFCDENPDDALILFRESFLGYHQEIARKLGILSRIAPFLEGLKKEFDNMVSICALGGDEDSQKSFSDHLLTFGERIATQIIRKYLEKSGEIKVLYQDARNLIVPDLTNPEDDGGFGVNLELTLENIKGALQDFHRQLDLELMITEGFITMENKNLGRNGSDTTLALFSVAYYTLGYSPDVVYLKADKLETRHDWGVFPYDEFLKQQEGYPQPFVKEYAVELYAKYNLPFKIRSSNHPKYCIIVGNPEMIQASKLINQRQSQAPVA